MGLKRSLHFRAWCGAAAVLTTGFALVAASAAAPPKIKKKEAEARSILAQVQALDERSGAAVEAWNGAKYQLAQIKAQEARNKLLLRWARNGYRIAEQRAEARLVALYKSDDPSAIDAILGAANLNDMLDRIETIHATTALDRRLVEQVKTKREVFLEPCRGTRRRATTQGADRPRARSAPPADRVAARASANGSWRRCRARFSN